MTDRAIKLGVSVVVYRTDRRVLASTLVTLAREATLLRHELGVSTHLSIIDNAAALAPLGELPLDDSFCSVFESIERFEPLRNLGYGGGHNLALLRRCYDYHLVLNPDVEIDPGALLAGIQYLRDHSSVAGVVPQGRGGSGEPLYLAKGTPSLMVLLLRALAPRAAKRLLPHALADYELHALYEAGLPSAVPLASGCFMLLRGRCLAATGGFAPEYFMYFEDFDLSRRIASQGPLIYLPSMRIVHYGGGVVRKGPWHIAMFCCSALRYFSRWGWRLF